MTKQKIISSVQHPATLREMFAMARTDLADLCVRACSASRTDLAYVIALMASWDATLAECEASSPPGPLSADAASVYARLASVIADPDMRGDVMIDWLDAFPEAITDLGANWDDI